MAETDLLPLPSSVQVDKHLPTGVAIYGYTRDMVRDYARANMEFAAAQRTRADAMAGEAVKHEARAERLAEALRVAEAALADIGDADREPGDDLAWCERRAAEPLPMIRALLRDQEEGK